ncbi:hypothetical protein [Priestia megaterium]|uniref:hypothetical protein n=1 Tax=Priestia megaterium TaxID=1404 RepID=UPI002D7EF284|nr:hypothetical protein [Priestia megaterium]MEB4860621.1 hypothetical protein [Priestia megaterium]
MAKLFNVLMEVSMEFVHTVNTDNMDNAWEKSVNNVNDFTTQIDKDVTMLSHEGEMTFKQRDHNIDIEEVYEEIGGEYSACGTSTLILSKNVKAYTYEQATLMAQATFNDGYLSMGNMVVKNAQGEDVKLSVVNYEIEVSDVEEVCENNVSTNLEKIFVKNLDLLNDKKYNKLEG